MKLEFMIAGRYMRARKRDGFISVIAWFSLVGIALGVATLIIVMSVMNGFRTELLTRILGLKGHITVYGLERELTDYDVLREEITGRYKSVISATPLVEGQVMAINPEAGGKFSTGALVRGMRAEDLASKKIISDNIVMGDINDFSSKDDNYIIMGSLLAHNLGIGVGDKVALIAPQTDSTVLGSVPRKKTFTLAATFNIGMYEYDTSTIFMPLDKAQVFFKLPGAVSGLEIMTSDINKAPELALEIYEGSGGRYRVYDWQKANKQFFSAVEVERNVMFLILTLIILVASFNIISSLIMLVKDKGKAIAILRTMGATKGMILRVFIICGSAVGFVGTALGLAGGLAFALNIETVRQWIEKLTNTELFSGEIYFLSKLPAEVNFTEVALVCGMAFGLSFLATIYPAWRASRLDPAEALRYE